MIKLSFCTIVCSILLVACQSQSADEIAFEQYLKKRFSIDFPEKKTTFFLVPSNQCVNCFKNASFRYIGSDSIFLITSGKVNERANNILIDSADELSNLKIINYSNTVICVEKGKIVETKQHIDLKDYLDGVTELY